MAVDLGKQQQSAHAQPAERHDEQQGHPGNRYGELQKSWGTPTQHGDPAANKPARQARIPSTQIKKADQ
jgi:hypothetical protein